MNKRIVVTIVCIVLALATVAGVVIAIIPRNNGKPTETESSQESSFEQTSDEGEKESAEETKRTELTSPPEGHTPIPDLNVGNEIYLDMDVVEKLQDMENEGKEYEVNVILDTMLLLINEFVDRDYSALAICQIQRFYFEFFEDVKDMDFDTLCDRLAECISSNGLDEDGFARKVSEQFGIDKNADFGYVYSEEVSS